MVSPRPFVIAHISDLHVSSFGDTFHENRKVVKRSKTPSTSLGASWVEVGREGSFRIISISSIGSSRSNGQAEASPATKNRESYLLLDREGYSHQPPKEDKGGSPLTKAREYARFLHEREAQALIEEPPDLETLHRRLRESPKNTNLRLLLAAEAVSQNDPDVVLITGDLTDDGAGYALIRSVFAKWVANGRLLAIPGNHDRYLFPLRSSARPIPNRESKRKDWEAFATSLGLELAPCGAWVRSFPPERTILVGLDSCAMGQPIFYRHNGAIGSAQLDFLAEVGKSPAWIDAHHRIVAFHHHLVPLSHGVGRGTPTEIGMRLEDARKVAELLNGIGATFVLHGHRHVSEERHPAGCNFRLLASPSLTLGCKSGDGPSFWRLELSERAHTTRVRIAKEAS